MKAEQPKHRHHKQPQFYLKGFAAKSSNRYQKTPDIWVYKKGEEFVAGKNPSLESVKEVGYGEDFYAFENKDGMKDYDKYEDLLRDDFEEPAKTVIEKIRRFEKIDENEKILLSRYVASMMTRGNYGKHVLFQVRQRELKKHRQKLTLEGYSEIEIKKACEELIVSHNIEIKGESDKRVMIESANKLANSIYSLSWCFFLPPNNRVFMTTDIPVLWDYLKTQQSWLLFPISFNVCLYASFEICTKQNNWNEEKKGFWRIDDITFERIREKIVRGAFKEIYCSQKAEWLVKFINNRIDNNL